MPTHKLADLKVGYACNNNCIHCVIAGLRPYGDRSTEDYKREMRESRARADLLVITGGEPTIRKDIFDLVSYAAFLGFHRITLQTNGRMFYYDDFASRMGSIARISYVVAVHAPTAQLHDRITQVKGSFDQTVQGIRNLRRLGQDVSGKVVISKLNSGLLPDIARLLVSLEVEDACFAFPHPMGNAMVFFDDVVPNITETSKSLHKAIDVCESNGIHASSEGFPFCLMRGYEDRISELTVPEREMDDIRDFYPDFNERELREGRAKGPSCASCRHNSSCKGPWKEYPQKFGWDEFVPVR